MDAVKITRAGELDTNTAQSSGMVRKIAITASMSGSQRMCASTMTAAPGTASEVHHHGEQDTIVYAAAGCGAIRFGSGGTQQVELGPGDFAFIPSWCVHQELNPGNEEVMWIITRSGPEPVVVNLPGFP